MNKKTLIIATGSLLLSLILIGFIFYLQTFKTVHIDMKQDDLSATIYNKDDETVVKVTQSGDIRLQPGDYSIITSGDKYENTPTHFTVGNTDTTVTIDPPYSAAYRDEILTTELPAINKAVAEAYPTIITGFTLDKGAIYKDGLWYGTTLTPIPTNPKEEVDVYRTVLKKEGNAWVVKAKPALVLGAKEYPDIPVEILRSINARQDSN